MNNIDNQNLKVLELCSTMDIEEFEPDNELRPWTSKRFSFPIFFSLSQICICMARHLTFNWPCIPSQDFAFLGPELGFWGVKISILKVGIENVSSKACYFVWNESTLSTGVQIKCRSSFGPYSSGRRTAGWLSLEVLLFLIQMIQKS